MSSAFETPDELVPDRVVRSELGGLSRQTIHRWDRDPKIQELGWPPPVRLRNRKNRQRKAFEAFKQALLQRAIQERGSAAA